jgi:type III pantothenate kinase
MIAIDVGNTKTAAALFRGALRLAIRRTDTSSLSSPERARTFLADLLASAAEPSGWKEGIVLSSVVPRTSGAFLPLAGETALHQVNHQSPLSFALAVKSPETVGADRIANLEGGVRKYGAPLLVVDVGTATTFSAIDSRRRFVGGAIAPGLRISAEALVSRTAALPEVEWIPPETSVGSFTGEALRVGILQGHARMIDGLISDLRRDLALPSLPVVVTGGSSALLFPLLSVGATSDPDLTLDGLRFLFDNLQTGVPHD